MPGASLYRHPISLLPPRLPSPSSGLPSSSSSIPPSPVSILRSPFLSPGIDIVPILKFQKLIEKNSFITRNFTKNEIEYCKKKRNSAVHFAGKFAAKEAVSKALKLEWKEGLNWKEIEIINEESGAPTAVLHKQTKSIFEKSIYTELQISISHCNEYAVAVAVVLS